MFPKITPINAKEENRKTIAKNQKNAKGIESSQVLLVVPFMKKINISPHRPQMI